jgi:hypothetical protein
MTTAASSLRLELTVGHATGRQSIAERDLVIGASTKERRSLWR